MPQDDLFQRSELFCVCGLYLDGSFGLVDDN